MKIEYLILLTVNVSVNVTVNVTATNVSVNAKINEVKCEIPNITNLATTSSLTAVENKIPSAWICKTN